jgi:hypothetical protein
MYEIACDKKCNDVPSKQDVKNMIIKVLKTKKTEHPWKSRDWGDLLSKFPKKNQKSERCESEEED